MDDYELKCHMEAYRERSRTRIGKELAVCAPLVVP